MSNYQYEGYTPKNQRGFFGNITLWIIGVLILIGLVGGVTFGVRWLTAPAKGKLQAREQINSGAFRIAAYNHFFDVCIAVQTDETRLAAQKAELKTAPKDDVARIQANIAGIISDRAEAINEYNADARKSYTIGQFKSRQLPYQLDQQEVHTRCAN